MAGVVDWDAVHRRLAAIGHALDSTAEFSAERAERVLEERARALARPVAEPADEDTIALLVCEWDGEAAAVEAAAVVEICRFRSVALLPGAKPPVCGVAAWRGELLTVLDLRQPPRSASDAEAGPWAAVLRDGDRRFALLVDQVRGLTHVPSHALHEPGPRAAAYVRAVTNDPMIVIDAAQLLRLYQ